MGIQTVAVFSDADRDAPHVQMADEAVHIGASPSAESYLVVDRIIEASRSTGAEAVHPGYGFLSEKSALVLGLEEAGVAFVGPAAKAIEVMGDKIASKALAESAGVPTIPGFNEVLVDAQDAVSRAGQIGYPVMLKASAGGGGKGMRVAWNDDECREGFERASSEARSSFSDDRVFIEKFVSQPRHIEIQVLADHHGNAIHLNERECSIQRRHQKVVEEAPSLFVDEALRAEMGAQALALAEAVGYTSAGTVEFIVDAERNFYFLEMNTRLQVEHPVTELITGIDLVEWMLRIAAGEELTLAQQDVGIRGWAMESRVYAEDPYRGFLPSSGRVQRFCPPDDAKGVRVDTGICEGGEVSLHYDPMIAKLVTHGSDREQAAQTMLRALDRFEIRGIQSNIPFLAALVQHPRFLAGETTTGFIEEEFPEGFAGNALSQDIIRRIVALVAVVHEHWHLREDAHAVIPQTQSANRVIQIDEDQYAVSVVTDQDAWQATVEGKTVSIEFSHSPFSSVIDFHADGIEVTAQLRRTGARYEVFHSGVSVDALVLEPYSAALYHLMPRKVAPDLSHLTLSPMPGLLVSIAVTEGAEVKAGDELAVIEAMKMENVIRAERDGIVLCVHAEPGAALEVDQQIVEFLRESSA